MKLLVLEDFYHKLNDEVNQREPPPVSSFASHALTMLPKVVDDFALDRTRLPVYYFGHAEVRLMIQTALTMSVSNGRIVKLQTMLAMLLMFQTGLRTSSLAAPYPQFRDKGRVSPTLPSSPPFSSDVVTH